MLHPATDRTPQVVILGDDSGPEMSAWRAAIHGAGGLEPERVRDVAGLRELVRTDGQPDLVLVCQRWSDEFPAGEVHEMLALLPLARWVCCYSSWCDSDGRTSAVWPEATRVPAARAAGRIRRELEVLRGARAALPWTAARDEVFAFDFAGPPREPSRVPPRRRDALPIVQVVSPDRELRRWLEDVFTAEGCRLVRTAGAAAPAVVVWDADPWTEEAAAAFREFCGRHAGARIVALVGFARPEVAAMLRGCGACCVVPKPVENGELLLAAGLVE